MNELCTQYQFENFAPSPSRGNTSSSGIGAVNGALTVQHSALPPAMQANSMQRDGVTRSTLAKARDNPLRCAQALLN
ncbi:hypothetical protein KXD40_006634 [Peronospora effusa]|uniref:Uncharacterized protein n=1 Tax=Peronospora effusa TaxID=542832 RepID=A0A3M6VIF8_9STRA|nr:hypothetical protein DD238_004190 [Peronospora effusa]RQM17576.1 hypothetical protein DD237_003121 [Peronospora effusa]UIZ24964.1 hypothetical protein KXD40_006634 [Peronospora effusa]